MTITLLACNGYYDLVVPVTEVPSLLEWAKNGTGFYTGGEGRLDVYHSNGQIVLEDDSEGVADEFTYDEFVEYVNEELARQ